MRRPISCFMVDPSLFTPPYDLALLEALRKAGVACRLISRAPRGNEVPEHYAADVDGSFYRVSEWVRRRFGGGRLALVVKGFEHVLDMFRLWRRVAKERPDILHFQWCPVPMIDAWFIRRLTKLTSVVLTVHDVNAFHGAASSWAQFRGWNNLLRQVPQIIVHTNESLRALRELDVDETKVTVIPHGLLELVQNPNYGPVENVREDSYQILFIGHIKPYKRLDLLIEALSHLKDMESTPPWHLTVAGSPAVSADEIRDWVLSAGIADRVSLDLKFLAESEMEAYIRRSQAVVFPYDDIDASGILMAVMPYGKAIVVSDLPAFLEVVDDTNAFVFDAGNVSALSNLLAGLVRDPAKGREFGRKAASHAQSIFSWNAIAAQTVGKYEKTLVKYELPGADQ